jgi:hypothetical protein
LVRELIPHARNERDILYKSVEIATHSPGATATMNREHLEVSKMADQLSDLHALTVAEAELSDKTIRDLRRVLYGLYAIVNLHFAKEDEIYSDILDHRLSIAEQDRLLAEMTSH